MYTLFYLGVIFTVGALTEWLSPKAGVPKVVGYLVLGVLIGPEVGGFIPKHFLTETHIVIDLSLALIAVLVGAKIKYETIKEMGKQIFMITLFEGSFAFIFVSTGFYILGELFGFSGEQSLLIGILFGGLSAATAPAATIATVQELQARGRFTSVLLAVVAADDALALILFSVAVTLGIALEGSSHLSYTVLLDSLVILFSSALVGSIGAIVSVMIDKLFEHHKGMETISTLGMVFIVYALSHDWGLEPLLAALVMGAVMSNISEDYRLVEEEIDNHLVEIIFMLFFILSAMHLNVSALMVAPYVIALYIILRFSGKYVGAWLGAKLSHADKRVQNYLALGLFPQAGVAIGLALSLQNEAVFVSVAPMILNVIIASTIVHESIGPILTKYILKKSGECGY
jgi:Kef-type K+ transport system membrane component KefB